MLIVSQQAVFAQLARHIAANRGGGGAGGGGEGGEEGEGGDPVVITEDNCSVM